MSDMGDDFKALHEAGGWKCRTWGERSGAVWVPAEVTRG